MQSGFYFQNNQILTDYFLLHKMQLIRFHTDDSLLLSEQSFLYLNQKKIIFNTELDVFSEADVTLIFNVISDAELKNLVNYLSQNKDHKILFIAHILFDYQPQIKRIANAVGNENILFLVDNDKNPFLISSRQLLEVCSTIVLPEKILNLKNNQKKSTRISLHYSFFCFIKQFQFYFLKILLKPQQSIKDFYATYNLHFFYGKFKSFFLNVFYKLRHMTLMSFIYLFSFLDYSKGFLIWCFYRIQWLLYRFHEFNLSYTFYPFRKIYWFISFQINKRILKKQ